MEVEHAIGLMREALVGRHGRSAAIERQETLVEILLEVKTFFVSHSQMRKCAHMSGHNACVSKMTMQER